MTHTASQNPTVPLKQGINNGTISKNAQVAGYAGHPNPTIAALVSNGTIDLSKPSTSLTLSGWGGE